MSLGEFYYSPRNWNEDEQYENGNYICECTTCGRQFLGHKRRITCKLCAQSNKNTEQQIQSTNDKQIGCRWGKTERCEYRPLSCPDCTMTLQTSTKKGNTDDNKH